MALADIIPPEGLGNPYAPPVFTVGDIEIHRIMEIYGVFRAPEDCWPSDAADVKAFLETHGDIYRPWALDPETGKVMLGIQSYVLKAPGMNVLVDTCVGCNKSWPHMPPWHQRDDQRWLGRLKAAGFEPESIDYVLCTHLHGDHVGWNTRMVDGRWVPTFPNAKYLMTAIDENFTRTTERFADMYAESVSPVIAAGQAQLIETDFALSDEVWVAPSHGHTPGHLCVRLRSKGAEATVTGDAFHSPMQLQKPDWIFAADADGAQAAATRRAIFESHCETDRLVLPAHFPSPTIGHIVPEGDAFGFKWKSV